MQRLATRLEKERQAIDQALVGLMPSAELYPPAIHEAMSYAVLGGGKRLRPVLVLSAAEVVGGPVSRLMPAAAAVEFVHASSLILDDLPCMDDGRVRRGHPTVHRVYGESTAILAAMSLLSAAFDLLAQVARGLRIRKGPATEAISELSRSIGCQGMSAGQHVDLEMERYGTSFENLEFVHSHKTGALFIAAARIGALYSRASDLQLQALTSYAKNLGLAFQITDDILDREGDPGLMGKDIGADRGKVTFVSLFGLEASRQTARQLVDTARRSLSLFGSEADLLRDLAEYVAVRRR